MIKGKLKNGFKYEINEKALESYEFLSLLNEVEKKPQKSIELVRMILGIEGEKALIESLKEDGFTPINKVSQALEEILENTSKLKKS